MNKLQADQLKIMIAADQIRFTALSPAYDKELDRPALSAIQLAHDLIQEECQHELLPALRYYAVKPDMDNLLQVIDGGIDTVVVVMQLFNSLNIDFQSCWDEVQRSNLAKIQEDGKVHKQPNGKWIKPEGWTPPNLEAVIRSLAVTTEVHGQ